MVVSSRWSGEWGRWGPARREGARETSSVRVSSPTSSTLALRHGAGCMVRLAPTRDLYTFDARSESPRWDCDAERPQAERCSGGIRVRKPAATDHRAAGRNETAA